MIPDYKKHNEKLYSLNCWFKGIPKKSNDQKISLIGVFLSNALIYFRKKTFKIKVSEFT